MSANFYVYPSIEYIPNYRELLVLGNENINKFLNQLGGLREVILDVELHNTKDHSKINFSIDDKLIINEEYYAWFWIKGVQGGTDFYFYKTNDLDKVSWQEEYKSNKKAQQLKKKIDRGLEIGHHWSFRKSAGQPGIIRLSYGLLAASLAKVTDGIIFSDDGAWEYSCFPALADDFFEWYFKPQFATENDDKLLTQECIKLIYKELT
jgi:hypothetical protein